MPASVLPRPGKEWMTDVSVLPRKNLLGPAGSSRPFHDEMFVHPGIVSESGAAFCPLGLSPQYPDGAAAAAAAQEEEEEFSAVCALLRYAPGAEASGVRDANQKIDSISKTSSPKPPGKSTLANARSGVARSLKALATNVYKNGSAVDRIQDITHRITVFALPDRLVTVHVHDAPFIKRLREEWDEWYRHSGPMHVINAIVKGCATSFRDAAMAESLLIDRLESLLFKRSTREYDQGLQLLYAVSRRASIHGRVLAPMPTAHRAMCHALGVPDDDPYVKDVLSSLNMGRVMCLDVRDATQSLLSLHFQRTASELEGMMRVLTIFSAVFIPLELINSVFGMNCPDLVWLHQESGPLKALFLMMLTSGATVAWFRARRFI